MKLSIEDITGGSAPDFKYNSGIVKFRTDWLIARFNFDFDVFLPTFGANLQRGFVWNQSQKQQLIVSILKNIYIPSLSAIEVVPKEDAEKSTLQIIDGKQRLSSVISFIKNEWPLDFEGKSFFYKDLSKSIQDRIKLFAFEINLVYSYPEEEVTDVQKFNWFKYLNFVGTPQDRQHLASLELRKLDIEIKKQAEAKKYSR